MLNFLRSLCKDPSIPAETQPADSIPIVHHLCKLDSMIDDLEKLKAMYGRKENK